VKKRMDEEAKKASRLEQKIKLLTQGYQVRGGKLWSQVQDTSKQMDTAATELECFQELQKQEQLAASYRVRNLTEEVNKQKALERTLQSRYGDLMSVYHRIQEQLEEHKIQIRKQEAIEAENRAREEAAAQNRAAEEENESVEMGKEHMNSVTDEEPAPAGSKQINEDQMDVDNTNVDGEFVGPIPPAPDTQGDVVEASVQENSSNAPSTNGVTTNGEACDMVDASNVESQDNTSGSLLVDAGNQEDGKNSIPLVGASERNTALSSDDAVTNEQNDMVPE